MKTSQNSSNCKVELNRDSTCRNGLTSLLIALMALVAILVLSATPTRAQVLTNWLANPGYEIGPTGAQGDATGWKPAPPDTWNGPAYETDTTNGFVYGSATVHVSAHSGTNACKVYGYYQAYTTVPGMMQTFSAAPGSQWTADAWANTETPDNMTALDTSYIQVLFINASSNYNSAVLLTCYSAPMSTNTPVNTWTHLVVTNSAGGTTLTAPAGTAYISYQLIFSQHYPLYDAGGSCYWDDNELIRTSKPDPEITVQPVPVTVAYGQTASFSVTADGQSALSYNWQLNSATITAGNASGITTSNLVLTAVTTANQGNYTVNVSDTTGGLLTSSQAYLTVNDPGVVSITPPLGQTVSSGSNVTMTVVAGGSQTLTYLWTTNGTSLAGNGHFSGATGPMLTISGASLADTGTYTVLIDGGSASASTGLKVVPASQLATNLVVNPGFEDGVWSEPWENAWTAFNGAGIYTVNQYQGLTSDPDPVYDGTYVAAVYATDPDNGFYQNVPVTAGATYHAGGWVYYSSDSPVGGTDFIELEVIFKSAGGASLATFTAPLINTNYAFTENTWLSYTVTNATGGPDLVAPASTVSATVQVYLFNWTYAGGAAYFDDLYLTQEATATPPSPPPFSVSASVSSGQINISFPTTNSATYVVLYTSNPSTPRSSWLTNTTVFGDGNVHTVPDTLGATARYYSVLSFIP